MIHDPHAQTLTTLVGETHPAFVLLARSDICAIVRRVN